ncbi:hypothetical protein UFOVP100_25 [uncultured Caudovirales phage]|uniref:Replication protein n=1 Tax=uncultured Caudovirales phage TaxID=2100421 RepID=A0A6J5L6T4_9CAUD|nr:hypothetical protein UFOVP100_25 [uncultured Caudovirales phage]
MNDHHFNIKVAIDFDTDTAIFLNNMAYWLNKTIANRKHFYENNYWIYNSRTAFVDIFPYWTDKQIRRIIDNCIKNELIIKGCFNKSSYDRTCWYAFTAKAFSYYTNLESQFNSAKDEMGQSICPNGQMAPPLGSLAESYILSIGPNGPMEYAQTGQPIPYNKIDNKISTKEREKASRSSIPDNFSSSQCHLNLASENNIDLAQEEKAFIDYYKAHGKMMVNWDAAFSNWLRKSLSFAKASRPKEHPVTASIREFKEVLGSHEFKILLN